ncbi:glycosyltransferase [Fulvivirga ulvae]|uniref:glycosyltransferase n=1 Tax=Fulvivirga ulvae TaxID=2904245 RepID=UPI001F2DEFC3|nr:glycosyltransferase [Fulvivirga ulvae]UII33619.1 glycosyltransferase [Fulvivirga ulvae]
MDEKELICIVIKPEASTIRSTQYLANFLKDHRFEVEYAGIFDEDTCRYFEKNDLRYKAFSFPEPTLDLNQPKNLHLYQVEAEQALMAECYNYYQECPPKLVLYEVLNTSWTLPFVKLGVPLLGISVTLSTEFNTRLPSVHSTYAPSKKLNLIDRMKIIAGWVSIYRWWLRDRLKYNAMLYRHFGLRRIPKNNFKRVFKKYGYRIVWGDYPTNDFRIDTPILYCCPAEFDLPYRKNRKRIFYGGSFVLQNEKHSEQFDWSVFDDQSKIIYATLGTMPQFLNPEVRVNFYKSILGAMEEMDGCELILQVGKKEDMDGLRVPDNVHIYDWVPHIEIFNKISLMVCHGGLGTLREAIYHGVPSVVFPSFGDQPGNSTRVIYNNLGVRGNLLDINKTEMLRLMNQVFQDDNIQRGVQKFQKIFRDQMDFVLGIDFFNQLMQKKIDNTTYGNVTTN